MPRPREEPTFFVDRSLGAYDVPNALKQAGATVEVHFDHFADDAKDVDWLPVVGDKGWIVLAKDRRIARDRLEVETLLTAGVGAFVLTSAGLNGDEMGQALATALPRMRNIVHTRGRPFIATVSRDGTVTMKLGGERLGGVRRESEN